MKQERMPVFLEPSPQLGSDVSGLDNENLAGQLQRDDLNKNELQELMGRVGHEFYRRHKELFVPLDDLIRKAGYDFTRLTPREPFVDVLEKDGGIVVGRYHLKEKRRVRPVYFILKVDQGDALLTLENSQEL